MYAKLLLFCGLFSLWTVLSSQTIEKTRNTIPEIVKTRQSKESNVLELLDKKGNTLAKIITTDGPASLVKVSLNRDHLEIDTPRKFYFMLYHKEPLAEIGRNIDTRAILSASVPTRISLSFQGYHGERAKTHFVKQRIFLAETEKKEFIFPEIVPGDLRSLRTAIGFPRPGKYRIYDIGFNRTQEIKPDSRVNYILNGGAERGWYGVGLQGREYIMSSEDMLIYDGLGHTWTDTLRLSLDSRVKRSGKYSFRYDRKLNQTGRFTLNPVPFVPGKSATLTAWCKGSRPKQRVYLGLFLGSGITYSGGADITNDRWTKCELHIPVWGKKPDGRIYLVGDPVNGYAAVNRVVLPEIGSSDPVWIDDVTYHIGGGGPEPKSGGITAHAVLNSENHCYPIGSPVKVTLHLSNLSGKAEKAEIRWKMLDFFGRAVPASSGTRSIEIAAGGEAESLFEFHPPSGTRGAMNLRFDVNGEKTGVYFGILGPQKPIDRRIGINYGSGNGNVQKAVEMLKEFRIGAVRLWSSFRRTPCFGYRDVDAFADGGFHVMMCLEGPEGHVPNPPGAHIVPKDLSGWAEEVKRFARRYKGKIHAYEIYNEPDFREGRQKNPDPLKYDSMGIPGYLRVLKTLSQSIRNADPKAQIGGPAAHSRHTGYITAVLNKGGAEHLDIITEHPYRQSPELPDYESDLQTIRSCAETHKKPFPIAASESGACSSTLFADDLIPEYERERTAYNTRLMLIALANGVSHFHHFVFDWNMSGTGWSFTLHGNPGNRFTPIPAPVMFACRAAADLLEDAEPLKRIPVGSSFKCYLFERKDNRRIAVLWKWNGNPAEWIPSGNLRKTSVFHDIMGSEISGTMVLNQYPLYIVSTLSSEELRKEVQNSIVQENGSSFDASLRIADRKSYIIRIHNLGSTEISGSISAEGNTKTFRGIAPEGFADLCFQSRQPITRKDYPLRVAIRQPEKATAKEFHFNLRAIAVPKTPKAPSIDGDLSDWPAKAEPFPLEQQTRLSAWTPRENSATATARMMWDENALYLAVTVFKKGYVENPFGKSSLWLGDSIQFAFDPLSNARKTQSGYQDDDFEYMFALWHKKPVVYSNAVSSSRYDSFSKSAGENQEIRRAIRILPDRTVYEMALPRLSVSPFLLRTGESMRGNILVNLANEKGRAGYLQLVPGIGENPKQPGRFLDMVLTP